MASLRRSVPSMSALSTFEAAARLGSFTQAASELGVTQAAVSRQIKVLENELNAALFLRQHRKVVLTQAGIALAGTVTGAFSNISEMIETIRRPHSDDTVSVGATLAFSHFWIMPRLSEFRARHPGIRLKLVAEDRTTDLRRDRLDVCIRFARPPFADGISIASHPDTVFPVCSPALLARLGSDPATSDIARMPLIASDNVNPSWLTWRSWAQALGLGPDLARMSDRSPLRFNHYTDSIEAALSGEGVALGWSILLSGHLAARRLVRIGSHVLTTAEQYHALVPMGRQPSEAAGCFLDWLGERFAAGVEASRSIPASGGSGSG